MNGFECIADIKKKLIVALINDKDIYECIKNTNSNIQTPNDLIYNNVMPYFYNLGVEKDQKVYIFIRLYSPRMYDRVIENLILDVGIVCHKYLMKYKGIMTRLDYLLPRVDEIVRSYNDENNNTYYKHHKNEPKKLAPKLGISNIVPIALNPFNVYDADYDGYILSYNLEMISRSTCNGV